MKKLPPGKLIVKIMWGMMMSGLDLTIVTLCNSSISREPNFIGDSGEIIPQSTVQWTNDIYSLTFAAFSILASKIGDRYGLTHVFWAAMIAFTIFSILCGVSKFIPASICPWPYGGFYVLIVARFFQGIAAAFLMANTMSLCSILVEEKDIVQSMAYNSLAFSIAIFCGPIIGGILVQWVDWSACFDINIIICIIGLIVSRDIPRIPKFVEPKVDVVGGFLCLFGLTLLPPDKNLIVAAVILIICGLLIMVIFIFWELHHPFALLPKILLKNKKLVNALLGGLFNFALTTPMTFQLPILLQTYHCTDPIIVAALNLIAPFVQMAAAIWGRKLGHQVTSFTVKLISSVFITVGILMLSFIVSDPLWVFAIQSVIFNLPLGLYFVSNNQYMIDITIRGNLGGCIQAFRETGFCLGICLLNMVQDIYIGDHWKDSLVPDDSTCKDPYFLEYRDIYYKSVSVSDWFMCLVSILAMLFGILSGFGKHEEHLKCYPKKLLEKDSDPEESMSLVQNSENLENNETNEPQTIKEEKETVA